MIESAAHQNHHMVNICVTLARWQIMLLENMRVSLTLQPKLSGWNVEWTQKWRRSSSGQRFVDFYFLIWEFCGFNVTRKNGGFAAIFARSGSPWKLPVWLGWPQNSTKMSGGARKTLKDKFYNLKQYLFYKNYYKLSPWLCWCWGSSWGWGEGPRTTPRCLERSGKSFEWLI